MIFVSFLILERVFHQCSSSDIPTRIKANDPEIDYIIKCPTEEHILLENDPNVKTIEANSHTNSLHFKCSSEIISSKIIIKGSTHIYFENDCALNNLVIHGTPILEKYQDANVIVNSVTLFDSSYHFPFQANHSNYQEKNKSQKAIQTIRICLTDIWDSCDENNFDYINYKFSTSRDKGAHMKIYTNFHEANETLIFFPKKNFYLSSLYVESMTDDAFKLHISNMPPVNRSATFSNISVYFNDCETVGNLTLINSTIDGYQDYIINCHNLSSFNSTFNKKVLVYNKNKQTSYIVGQDMDEQITIATYRNSFYNISSCTLFDSLMGSCYLGDDVNISGNDTYFFGNVTSKELRSINVKYNGQSIISYDNVTIIEGEMDDVSFLSLSPTVDLGDNFKFVIKDQEKCEIRGSNHHINVHFETDYNLNLLTLNNITITPDVDELSVANIRLTNANISGNIIFTIPKNYRIFTIKDVHDYGILRNYSLNISYDQEYLKEIEINNCILNIQSNCSCNKITLIGEARVYGESTHAKVFEISFSMLDELEKYVLADSYVIRLKNDIEITGSSSSFRYITEGKEFNVPHDTDHINFTINPNNNPIHFKNISTFDDNITKIYQNLPKFDSENSNITLIFNGFMQYFECQQIQNLSIQALYIDNGIIPVPITFDNRRFKKMAILNSSTPINIQDLKIIDSSLEIIGVIRIENVVVVGGAYISPSQSLQINKFTLDYFNIYGSEPYEINLREEILINNLVFLPRLISHKYTLIGTYYRISNITIDSTFIGKDGYSRYDSYLLPEIEGKKSLININNITFKHDLKIHDDILNFLCKGCLFGMKNKNDLLTNIFLNLEPSYIKDRKIKMACRGGGVIFISSK